MTEEKQNITIACTATGQPQPSITWSKSVGFLPKGRNQGMNGALTIYNVTKKDRGIYICRAQNILGSVSDTVLLMVFYPLRPTSPSGDSFDWLHYSPSMCGRE